MLRRFFAFLLLALAFNALAQVTTDPALTGLPQAPGSKTSANSVSVTPASDATFTTTGTITSGTVTATVSSGTITVTAMPSVGYYSTTTFTRPENTTAYTAVDTIGGSPTAVITFSSIGSSGGSVMLTSCDLRIDVTAVPSGMGNMRLELYRSSPASALADNAPWDLPSGDRAAYIGYVDLGTPVDKGSTLFTQADNINKQIKLASGSTSLSAYLVTIGGFTPAGNSEVYTLGCRGVGL